MTSSTSDTHTPKQKFTGYWIPVELSKLGLNATEQFLLSMIDSLEADEPDYCFASNAYFAEKLDLSESRISFYITKFKKAGLIEEVSTDGRRRRIRTLKENWYKKKTEDSRKTLCVKTSTQTTCFQEGRLRENANHIVKNYSEEEKQQQQPAAALPKQEKKELKDPINVNLLYIDIPDSEKRWISERYEDADIRHAVAWANHPETKIKATLEQAIKWACANKPAIPAEKEDNRKIATEVKSQVRVPIHLKNIWKMEVLTSCVEIICGPNCQVLEYCEKQFRDKLMELIRKSGCVLS